MPQSVRLAGLLLLGALAFSLLSLLALVARAASSVGVSTLFTVVLQTLVYDVAWGILVFFLWKRQNWARFVIVVFVVYTIAMSVFGFSRGLASIGFGNMSYLFSLATTFAVAAVRAYAAYLLYQPEANAYFKNR